jgi:hypothetical protein
LDAFELDGTASEVVPHVDTHLHLHLHVHLLVRIWSLGVFHTFMIPIVAVGVHCCSEYLIVSHHYKHATVDAIN